jgi:hypothetical protein
MPISLMLQQMRTKLFGRLKKLNKWSELIDLEELLLDRLRGAFLTHWFGQGLQVRQLALTVAIGNIDELQRRYEMVRQAQSQPAEGLNLTEPLAGMAGMLVGTILSPAGLTLAAIAAGLSYSGNAFVGILAGIGGLILSLITAPLGLAIGVGGGLLGFPLAIAAGSSEQITGVHRLLGSVAELLDAGITFINQLLGPRSGVANPLVRAVLELLDKVAELVPFLIALVAILIARGGGILRPLAQQIPPFFALIYDIRDVIVYLVTDLYEELSATFRGTSKRASIFDAFRAALSPLRRIITVAGSAISDLLHRWTPRFTAWGGQVMTSLTGWWESILPIIRSVTTDHPVVRLIGRLIDHLRSIIALFGSGSSSTPTPAPTPAPSSSPPGPVMRWLVDQVTPPSLLTTAPLTRRAARVVPGIVDTAEIVGMLRTEGVIADPFAPTREFEESIERLRHPPSVFASERRALRGPEGESVQQQIEAFAAEEHHWRGYLYTIIQNILPSIAGEHLGTLRELFTTIDTELYRVEPWAPPVRTPDTRTRLMPVISNARVVVGTQALRRRAERWATQYLQESLDAQEYVVTVGAQAGGG